MEGYHGAVLPELSAAHRFSASKTKWEAIACE